MTVRLVAEYSAFRVHAKHAAGKLYCKVLHQDDCCKHPFERMTGTFSEMLRIEWVKNFGSTFCSQKVEDDYYYLKENLQ